MLLGSTRGAFNHLKKRAKQISFFAALVMQVLYIAYLVYIIAKGAGIVGVNIAMGALSVGYLAYFLVMEYRLAKKTRKERKEGRKATSKVKRIYRWVKLFFKSMNLGIMLYGLWVSEAIATAVSTIFTTLMIIVWIVELVIALGTVVVCYVIDVMLDAFEDDKKTMEYKAKAPVRGVKKIARFFGFGSDEVEEKYEREERFVEWEAELRAEKEREKAHK